MMSFFKKQHEACWWSGESLLRCESDVLFCIVHFSGVGLLLFTYIYTYIYVNCTAFNVDVSR